MNTKRNTQARRRIKNSRKIIVAELYKRGWSIAKIAEEVRNRMNSTCSTRTIWNDLNELLAEWREANIKNIDDKIQLELERIDDAIRELWEQWDKSKENWIKEHNQKVGKPSGSDGEITTVMRSKETVNVIGLGNPAYMAEIRQQLTERRKLLGLYAAEKKEITGKNGTPLIPPCEMDEAEIKAEIEKIRAARKID